MAKQLHVGIIGGGQLARMLIQSAQSLGLIPYVLCEKKQDSAAQVTSNWVKGNPKSKQEVIRFIKKMDWVTVESEHIPLEGFGLSEKLQNKIFPSVNALSILRKRSEQKAILNDFFIPTASHLNILDKSDLISAVKILKLPLVLKKVTDAYDGQGTHILDNPSQILKFKIDHPYIAEEKIKFKHELALTLARHQNGQIFKFPLVESFQKNKRCDWVIGPRHHPNLAELERKIITMLEHLNYVGVITFELFDCGHKLLVNEVAPRVHNTAHHTLTSFNHSQFDLHWLSMMGQRFPNNPALSKNFGMLNLIGPKKEVNFNLVTESLAEIGSVYWYGKQHKIGRKLGHVNFINQKIQDVIKIRDKYFK